MGNVDYHHVEIESNIRHKEEHEQKYEGDSELIYFEAEKEIHFFRALFFKKLVEPIDFLELVWLFIDFLLTLLYRILVRELLFLVLLIGLVEVLLNFLQGVIGLARHVSFFLITGLFWTKLLLLLLGYIIGGIFLRGLLPGANEGTGGEFLLEDDSFDEVLKFRVLLY